MSYIVYENVSDLILVFRPSDAEAAAKVLGDLSTRWASLFESKKRGASSLTARFFVFTSALAASFSK